MNRIKEIADRARLDTFITCLMDGVDISVDNNLDDCEKAIEESYDKTIDQINKLGILVGARLQRELVKGYDKLDSACVK